jgi:hypothetical protein
MRLVTLAVWVGISGPVAAQLKDAPPPPAGFPKFKVQEIATDLKIGYAVHVCDVNGDGKPDIVVVDKERVVWYENPTWKMRPIITGKTKPDNVCIASLDIDGDGKIDFVLGAGWRPADTKNPGTLQWLSRGKTLDEEWTVHPIPCDEPTVHRVKVADIYGDGKPAIVMAPLQGRDCTAKGNWVDGRPVRIMAYKVPTDPTKAENWKSEVISEELHVVHGLFLVANRGVVTASLEGVHRVGNRFPGTEGTWKTLQWRDEEGEILVGNRTASEVTMGAAKPIELLDKIENYAKFVATIEPWHGNQVVVYTMSTRSEDQKKRQVIDDHLRWGHAVRFADLTGEKSHQLILGVRDNPDPKQGDTFTEKRGVRIYRNTDGKGLKWDRYILEDGGVAVEDLTVADLNGDGKPDIIAVGRQTGNCRIYWNQGK